MIRVVTILPRSTKARCSAAVAGSVAARMAAGTQPVGNPAEADIRSEDSPAVGRHPFRTLDKHECTIIES